MSLFRDFHKRIGNVSIPVADTVPVTRQDANTAPVSNDQLNQAVPVPGPFPPIQLCHTTLKEGCYTVTFVPKGTPIFGVRYRGTVRVESLGAGNIRFSGDLYSYSLLIPSPPFPPLGPFAPADSPVATTMDRTERIRLANLEQGPGTEDSPGAIPVYSRKSYSSYLKGTSATLTTVRSGTSPCWFALNFDEFRYTQPASGFSGSFPVAPTRSITWILNNTATPNSYTGTAKQGTTELGSITMQWISPKFRAATLSIYRLVGAENPPASVPASGGGVETFGTVFNTINWDLSFSFVGDIPMPPALVGVQDPNQCWSMPNYATLLSSIPGYNPSVLDTVWKAYQMAVPAKIGCSRGFMFDTGSGNPNNIPREGCATQTHDGYPKADSVNFGAAEGKMQKDVPRAFLRSASHEVGHTFNQIHQEFEGGSDNSIMTTTPSVADVLHAQGKTFPNDINLGFNANNRRHLVHLPDPAVRPGAMDFFGGAVNCPQADEVQWPGQLTVSVTADPTHVALGEATTVTWTMTNNGTSPVLVPTNLDIESLTARVSSTDGHGNTVFMRPAEQVACFHNPLKPLEPGEKRTGSTTVFWGRDGFVFERPGRYVVDVIVLWQIGAIWVGSTGEVQVWVSFPMSDQDNRVAALMMNPEVGRAIASPHAPPSEAALSLLSEAQKVHSDHPALKRIHALGMQKHLKLSKKP